MGTFAFFGYLMAGIAVYGVWEWWNEDKSTKTYRSNQNFFTTQSTNKSLVGGRPKMFGSVDFFFYRK